MTVWTDHVKKWAREHGITYGCAVSKPECSQDYHGVKKSKKMKWEVQSQLKSLYPAYAQYREEKSIAYQLTPVGRLEKTGRTIMVKKSKL